MIQSPKNRFQSVDKDVSVLRDIVDSQVFVKALDAALLQITEDITGLPGQDAGTGFQLMKGARLLRAELIKLAADKTPLSGTKKTDNLIHDA